MEIHLPGKKMHCVHKLILKHFSLKRAAQLVMQKEFVHSAQFVQSASSMH